MPNPEDRRSALLRETEKGLGDSLGHLWPYIEEMRGIEESFSEEERAVISRFLKAATEATNQHAERLSKRGRARPQILGPERPLRQPLLPRCGFGTKLPYSLLVGTSREPINIARTARDDVEMEETPLKGRIHPSAWKKSPANFCRLLWLGVQPVESGFARGQLQPQVSSSISRLWGYPNELVGPDVQLVHPAHRAR
jgi:hypothetical protein